MTVFGVTILNELFYRTNLTPSNLQPDLEIIVYLLTSLYWFNVLLGCILNSYSFEQGFFATQLRSL